MSAGKLEHLERGENIHQSVSGSRLVWKGVSLPRCSLMPLSSECLLTCPCLGQVPSRLRHRLSFAHTYCSRSSPLFPDPSSFVIHMVCSVLTCVLDYMQVAPFYILANHVDGTLHFTLYILEIHEDGTLHFTFYILANHVDGKSKVEVGGRRWLPQFPQAEQARHTQCTSRAQGSS